jgi:hypothetical protein
MGHDKTLKFYHGGREWFGDFEVNPKSSAVMAHGPGLYLTNGIETARHYAKGGGVVQLIGVDPNAKLICDVKTTFSEMTSFLKGNRIRNSRDIYDCLTDTVERMETENLPLEALINLMVNFKSLVPSSAKPLNEFIVSQGADIAVFRAPMFTSHGQGNDEWSVVFNPNVIISRKKVDMKKFDWSETRLPTYKEQLSSISALNASEINAASDDNADITMKM